jgi:hypothetical protein
MPATVKPLLIEQGATWGINVIVSQEDGTPKDLTDCQAYMQVRTQPDSADPPLVSLSTDPGGGISVQGPQGLLAVNLTRQQTAALDWQQGVYDLLIIYPDDTSERVLAGGIGVSAAVTRP